MRPKGKWLLLGSRQRYLLGRETLLLMGFPLHRMSTGNLPESVTWLTHTIGNWSRRKCLRLIRGPKVLQDLGGNSMSVRVVMAVLAAALCATDPQKMSQSWKSKKVHLIPLGLLIPLGIYNGKTLGNQIQVWKTQLWWKVRQNSEFATYPQCATCKKIMTIGDIDLSQHLEVIWFEPIMNLKW